MGDVRVTARRFKEAAGSLAAWLGSAVDEATIDFSQVPVRGQNTIRFLLEETRDDRARNEEQELCLDIILRKLESEGYADAEQRQALAAQWVTAYLGLLMSGASGALIDHELRIATDLLVFLEEITTLAEGAPPPESVAVAHASSGGGED